MTFRSQKFSTGTSDYFGGANKNTTHIDLSINIPLYNKIRHKVNGNKNLTSRRDFYDFAQCY